MVFKSFCGCLSLEVGVIVVAVIFMLMGPATFIVNLYQIIIQGFTPSSITVFVFASVMVVAGFIVFLSVYARSEILAVVAVMFICSLTVLWVVLCCISFYNKPSLVKYVCISKRCPESFWLAQLKYREMQIKDGEGRTTEGSTTETSERSTATTDYSATTETPQGEDTMSNDAEETTEMVTVDDDDKNDADFKKIINKKSKILNIIQSNSNPFLRKRIFQNLDNFSPKHDESFGLQYDDYYSAITERVKETSDDRGVYKFGPAMIGAVFLFICNLLFLLYAILLVWSYGREVNLIHKTIDQME